MSRSGSTGFLFQFPRAAFAAAAHVGLRLPAKRPFDALRVESAGKFLESGVLIQGAEEDRVQGGAKQAQDGALLGGRRSNMVAAPFDRMGQKEMKTPGDYTTAGGVLVSFAEQSPPSGDRFRHAIGLWLL
jgi:hypothetical protein